MNKTFNNSIYKGKTDWVEGDNYNSKHVFNSKKILVLMLLIMCVACIISVYFLSSISLRLDESQNLWQISQSPINILKTVSQDVHVPFYHLLLHYWVIKIGSSVEIARLMSLIFFLLSIPAIFILSFKINKNYNAALLSSFLLSISSFAQWYSSELRMYSLFLLLAIINQYFFLRIWSDNKLLNWVMYLVISILGIYTHYFFILLLITELIFSLIYKPKSGRIFYTNLIITFIALFVSYLPWFLVVRSQNSFSNTQPLLNSPGSDDIFNLFSQLLFGFQDNITNTIIIACWPLVVAIIFFHIQKITIKKEIVFIVLSSIIPVVIAFTVSVFIRPVFLSRYLIFILPSIFILISNSLSNLKTVWLKQIFTVFVVVIMLSSLFNQIYNPNNPAKENFREIAFYVSKMADFKDVVALSAPFTIYPFEYYYNGRASLKTIPDWNRFDDKSIPQTSEDSLKQQVDIFTKKYSSVWLVMSYDQGFNTAIIKYFEQNFRLNQKRAFSKGLELYNFQLKYV